MKNKSENERAELVSEILGDDIDTQEDEETLHQLLEEKVARDINEVSRNRLTLGERLADHIAQFAGSWTFILIFIGCLLGWIILNALLLRKSFDPYPFILLNLVLSCVAAIQAPVIMMSQNRQEEKDRLRAQNDFKINLKSEIIIEDLHEKLDRMIENQQNLLEKVERLEKELNEIKR